MAPARLAGRTAVGERPDRRAHHHAHAEDWAWVVTLHVDEGQAVRQGQLLATLDDRAQRDRVRAAEEQATRSAERSSRPMPSSG